MYWRSKQQDYINQQPKIRVEPADPPLASIFFLSFQHISPTIESRLRLTAYCVCHMLCCSLAQTRNCLTCSQTSSMSGCCDSSGRRRYNEVRYCTYCNEKPGCPDELGFKSEQSTTLWRKHLTDGEQPGQAQIRHPLFGENKRFMFTRYRLALRARAAPTIKS